MKDLLGGKGAGLAEMTNAGVAGPPGFTIIDGCLQLLLRQQQKLPKRSSSRSGALDKLEKLQGRNSATPKNPLLVQSAPARSSPCRA